MRTVLRLTQCEIKFELQHLRLQWFSGGARTSALGPMGHHLPRPARAIGHSAVERLDREPTRCVAGNDRVKAPAEAVDLNDVTGLDALQSHRF
jgi:hypothetical protein